MLLNFGWTLESPGGIKKNLQRQGHPPNQLHQNLWAWDPGMSSFKSYPDNSNMWSSVITTDLNVQTQTVKGKR